ELLKRDETLVMPGAQDALSARLIEQAGFDAFFIGGFQIAGIHYALPDIGLISLGDIAPIVRNILRATSLPVMMDIDDGYGDVKNVVHTVHTYEDMGVGCMFIEDQVSPKRCGHLDGKRVVPVEDMEAKIRAAVGERKNLDTFLIARTDALAIEGLDAALHRGERYLAAGADGLFVESPLDVDQLIKIGAAFDAPMLANMLESGRTPILKPSELKEIGYDMAIYGITLLMHITKHMQAVLEDLRSERLEMTGSAISFDDYKKVVGFDDWDRIENIHSPETSS
ncbi:MAG: isocitrate lyase/PEP mutase family protein, partial [Alphaproteobacteria bacterium]|nr:isocitrate lyase/PEP mutase family protein [Alphaproteobacteria bacterium]